MYNTLQKRPVTLPHHNSAVLLRPPIHHPEYDPERGAHDRRYDGESSIAPAPRGFSQESRRQYRARERVAQIRAHRDADPDQSILHERGVCDEDIENVVHAIHADPVKDLGCSIRLDVLAVGERDET